VTICRGDKNPESLGDISSGDISSGDKLSPELKEPEPIDINNYGWEMVIDQLSREMPSSNFGYVKNTRAVRFDGNELVVAATDQMSADWLESRLKSTVERMLVGILNQSVKVVFTVVQDVEV
jgi:hypothetical protein